MEYNFTKELNNIEQLEKLLELKFPSYKLDHNLLIEENASSTSEPPAKVPRTDSEDSKQQNIKKEISEVKVKSEVQTRIEELNSMGYLGISLMLSSFDNLPVELLRKVFSYLSIKDLGKVASNLHYSLSLL